MPRPFYLGLSMTGTVSVGAYTAGVIDFLVEAMDAWYAERERQAQHHSYDDWAIPPHELELAVMAGASGGGITSALAAAGLTQPFDHIRTQDTALNPSLNPLFQSWVVDIDMTKLLGHADLDAEPNKVVSLLDSTPVHDIARKAFSTHRPLSQRRPWVRDGLKVILTLTNVRGIPYSLDAIGDPESSTVLYYADRQEFGVYWSGAPASRNISPLHPDGTGAWQQLGRAAVATSAFPIVLASQKLQRTAGEFNHRGWRIAIANPKCGPDGECLCEKNEEMPPAWTLADDCSFETLNVDGGATNNSPTDCVRLDLAALPPIVASGHNPRDPVKADRAVVNIAPLPLELKPGIPEPPSDSLFSLPGEIIGLLLSQSRMQGENLRLTADPNVASRWAISPTSEISGAEPLAGSTLSAFGGFVAQVFREHDYQLGRLNCQQFLMREFGVPWDNVILKQYPLSAEAQARLDADYGFDSETKPLLRLCPLIPVVPALRSEINVDRKAIHRSHLEPLADLAVDRTKRVLTALLAESGRGWVGRAGFEGLWFFLKDKVRDKLLCYAGGELARHGFVY